MLPSVITDVALASLRSSFQLVSQQASSELRSISARVHGLPEHERARLLIVVHDLEALQLRLRQLIDQLSIGGALNTNIIEVAIRDQFDLLRKLTALAERTGLNAQTMGSRPAAALQALQEALQALPANGFHLAPGPTAPYSWEPARRVAMPEEADYLEGDKRGHWPPAPQPVARDEGPRRWAFWSPLRDVASVGLMLGAAFAGSYSFFDRTSRPGAPGDTLLAVLEPLKLEQETELSVAGQSEAIKKFQGRLGEERGASPAMKSAAPRNLVPSEQPGLGEVPAERPMAPSSRGKLDPAVPQRLTEVASADVSALPPATVRLDPSFVPNPRRNGTAPSHAVGRTAIVAPSAAVAAKPAASKPTFTPADPDAAEPSGALFVPVLSTHKDVKAAREAFAELQKQHGAVLSAKQSEVQTSTSETGTWYRLVVTPASSKEMAMEMCNSLRVAGYGRCWVKPY
jgi:SPOR domain